MSKHNYTIVISAGWGGSGPGHWQDAWLKGIPQAIKILQKNWTSPNFESWITEFDQTIQSVTQPIVLVAHSLGSVTALHWASRNHGTEAAKKIKGALLVALPDPTSKAYQELKIKGFDPIPLEKLSFPSILVTSRDDPFVSFEKSREYADSLGSEFVDIGDKGHIYDVGDWPEGKVILEKLL